MNKTNANWSETRKCLINIPFEYSISKVKVYHRKLKLQGKHQLLIGACYSNLWVKRAINTIKKTTDDLLVASYKFGLEVNAE
jgi:hypothetical protein